MPWCKGDYIMAWLAVADGTLMEFEMGLSWLTVYFQFMPSNNMNNSLKSSPRYYSLLLQSVRLWQSLGQYKDIDFSGRLLSYHKLMEPHKDIDFFLVDYFPTTIPWNNIKILTFLIDYYPITILWNNIKLYISTIYILIFIYI